MSTKGVGVYGINSVFSSGNLIFYEKAVGRTATGDVLTIGTTAVNVGGTSQAVDFGWYATSLSAVISASGAAMTLTGIDLMMSGAAFLDFAGATLTPDSGRTYRAISIGYGHAATYEKNITMAAAATQHLDPIAMNLNIIGANPTDASTVNGIFQLITHDTTDMSYLRLKNADWNIVVGKDIQDAYCYQGEIDFNASGIAVGGEAAVMGLVMNAGTNAVTGNLRGLIISMQGSGSYASVIGIELRTTCGDVLGHGLAEGIRISGTPLPVVGIAMGNQTNNNEGPQYAFFFPSTGSPDTGPWSATNATGDSGKIAIKIGANTRYINVYTS